jgi:hypothetical protein
LAKTKPDPISVGKTHSVSWLAQFVCRIVTALEWEREFRCEGVESLADFKTVVENVNSVDPGSYLFRSPVDGNEQGVREFAQKMDALLDLFGRHKRWAGGAMGLAGGDRGGRRRRI